MSPEVGIFPNARRKTRGNLASRRVPALKNNDIPNLARSLQGILRGPMVGPQEHKKGNTNVCFRFRPSVRHGFRRRLPDRDAVRLGRHLAADRVTLNMKGNAMNGRFLVNRRDAKIMGVAAGLADYTGIDPLIVRLGFVAATLVIGPVMILFYLLAGWLAPSA